MGLTDSQLQEIGLILLNHGMNCWQVGKAGAFNCSEESMESLASALGKILVILGEERSIAYKYLEFPEILCDIGIEKYTGETSAKLQIFRKITKKESQEEQNEITNPLEDIQPVIESALEILENVGVKLKSRDVKQVLVGLDSIKFVYTLLYPWANLLKETL